MTNIEYAQWEPVQINGGGPEGFGAFFFNGTGLQWDDSPGAVYSQDDFGGWLVCDWYHGVPQLFMKWDYYNTTAPSNCAMVDLFPEYI